MEQNISMEVIQTVNSDKLEKTAGSFTKIVEQKLYRERYGTLQDYAKARWGISRQYLHRVMKCLPILQVYFKLEET